MRPQSQRSWPGRAEPFMRPQLPAQSPWQSGPIMRPRLQRSRPGRAEPFMRPTSQWRRSRPGRAGRSLGRGCRGSCLAAEPLMRPQLMRRRPARAGRSEAALAAEPARRSDDVHDDASDAEPPWPSGPFVRPRTPGGRRARSSAGAPSLALRLALPRVCLQILSRGGGYGAGGPFVRPRLQRPHISWVDGAAADHEQPHLSWVAGAADDHERPHFSRGHAFQLRREFA